MNRQTAAQRQAEGIADILRERNEYRDHCLLTDDPASVERLGAAMEQACDALSVHSLSPADARAIIERLRGEA